MSKSSFRNSQQKFQRSRTVLLEYEKQLRAVAKQCGIIVNGLVGTDGSYVSTEIQRVLRSYSDMLGPWAKNVANRMLLNMHKRDAKMWKEISEQMGQQLAVELETTKTGELFRQALNEQVALIKSLPLEAAERVHHLTQEALLKGERASTIVEDILRTGEVTKSRAVLIARTEVARTATELTKVRATEAGLTHYVWRTSEDTDVRSSHKKMNNKVFAFNQPPEVEPGKFYHPGEFPNCRCYAEVIVPENEK